jgi:hypothetical protein
MIKKKSVGLIILTEVFGFGLVAVLKARGSFNTEKMDKESYAGVYQVTVHGGLKRGESFMDALFREVKEELGKKAEKIVKKNKAYISEINLMETDDKIVMTYMLKLPSYFLNKIRLNADSGEIRLVKSEEVGIISDIKDAYKVSGVADRRIVVMFPDEKESVKAAFKRELIER